ncbi:MAG: hypothetical protein G3W63_19480 [Xanthomonas euvesicatoria]|uniref:Integron gene cassette protein n=2 Tax=root TaxID=1 RepID=A0A3G1GLH5_9CAUD|nr:putative integron gene cassette protein [Xanthomonas phage KPhi1]NEK74945.1 hypothetical protein [Xanthomonas euvesicatoria]UGL62916.1 hypothetical protein [Xanthomonas phage MYK3]APQ41941.1 putative integron gene cassette protein [Xanthomonas phage KPhi1]NEK91675.1 hypothetical protein [Xanthomonas euvesicatoria]NEL31715.1 hypothetical protein [Xanthomonas euvesicatoria]
MIRHFELVDAVNNAVTKQDHDRAYAYLRGYREAACIDSFGLMEADMHSMGKYGEDMDMCCGVLFRSFEA